jgi:5'-deoxynucleotidase YfbR-like HD superfamily hydrolase
MTKWNENDIEKLKLYYTQFNTPSDQIIKEKDTLGKFTEWFNEKFAPNNQFSPEDVADQLLKLRKSGKLPRIRK